MIAAISGNSVTSNASAASPQVTVTASAFPTALSGWALGAEGGKVSIWHTNNAGSAWQVQWRGSGSPLSIVAANRTHAWALIACIGKKPPCGREGRELLATSSGGTRWRVVARLAASVNRVYFGTDRFGVAVSDACLTNLALPKCPGQLLVTRDGGARWSTVLTQPAPVFAAVSATGQLWAAETVPGAIGPHATDLRFLTSTDGGHTWRPLGQVAGLVPLSPDVQVSLGTEPTSAPMPARTPALPRLAWAAVFDPLSCAMHGCAAAELLTSGTDGLSWTSVNLPDRYPDECGPDGIAFAAAADGSAWAATGRNGAACEPPLGLVYLRRAGRPGRPGQPGQRGWQQLPPWQQDQIDSLTAVSRTVAYAVGGQGALSRTEDGGLHWTQVLPAGTR